MYRSFYGAITDWSYVPPKQFSSSSLSLVITKISCIPLHSLQPGFPVPMTMSPHTEIHSLNDNLILPVTLLLSLFLLLVFQTSQT